NVCGVDSGGLITCVPPDAETERSRINSDKLRILKGLVIQPTWTWRRLTFERSRRLCASLPRLIGFPGSVNLNLHLEITTCSKVRVRCIRITRRRRWSRTRKGKMEAVVILEVCIIDTTSPSRVRSCGSRWRSSKRTSVDSHVL